MEKYENIKIVGEGSYGIVMKCRDKETCKIVAIKKFLETEDDVNIRKMVFREIRMLKKLHHDNLVNMIEVFRRRKRFYLVFDYLDHTVLDELEASPGGLGPQISRRHIFQVLRGLNFCHANHIMHRDIKPENILVSSNGVIKICDFGFARFISGPNESCTDYVATRWYRAPELLVGDLRYGKAVDIWALGCLYAEMVTGDPLFPGKSDVDQLYLITKLLGGLCKKHQTIIKQNTMINLPTKFPRRSSLSDDQSLNNTNAIRSLRSQFKSWTSSAVDFLSQCLRMDPENRSSSSNLLHHFLFMQDDFAEKFLIELKKNIYKENVKNSMTLRRIESKKTANEKTRVFYGSAERWQIQKNGEEFSTDDHQRNKKLNNFGSKSSAQRSTNSQEDSMYIGSLSITPNTTYIKLLDNTSFYKTDQKNQNIFSFPALPPSRRK